MKALDGTSKPKKSFDSEKDALDAARTMNASGKMIHKAIIYKCPVCFKWHVGRSWKELTEKDKRKAEKFLGK